MSNPEAGVESPESGEAPVPQGVGAEPGDEGRESPEQAAAESPEQAAAESPEQGPEDQDAATEEEPLPPLMAVLEAALFASAEAVPLTRLTRVLGAWTRKQVSDALKELAQRQEREGSGLRVVEAGGGFQLRSVREYAPWVRKFFAERPPRLSRAVLETVAVIAYRQPATRGEIEAVRGVNCDAILGTLTARGLVQVIGRRQSPGRPVEYGTTRLFLELFSLRDLSQLPPLPDPSSLAELVDSAESDDDGEARADAAGTEDSDGAAVAVSGEAAPGEDGDADEAGADQAALHDGAGPSVPGTGVTPQSESRGAGEDDGPGQRAASEDPEPGGDRLPEGGGGIDSRGPSPGQREGDPGAGGEG